LSHANTNGISRGGYGAIAILNLGHASRPIGLELFAIERASIGSHPISFAYLRCTAAENDKCQGR